MTTIISGTFQQQEAAQSAWSALAAAGAGRTTRFFVNPPGQHDLYPGGGDEDKSAGTDDAGGGAAAGAAVGGSIGVAVGIATLPLLGPAAVAAAAGVGAYAGSLYGALGNIDDKNTGVDTVANQVPSGGDAVRKSGMLVAIAAPTAAEQDAAIRILRAHGATDIERAEGTIVAGEWTDFNPLAPLRLVTNY
jgi:hypothetical protein